MALTDESNGSGFYMPVAPAYGAGNNGGFGGFGNDWGWIILLLLFAGGGWGNGFGGGFNNQLGYDFPWLINGQNGINANTNAGFQNAALQSSIGDLNNAVVTGFGNVQTSLCGGFAGVNASINGAQNAVSQQMYTNQLSDLERSYASQTAVTQGMNNIGASLQNCCCENRAGIADLKYTIATENCADRSAVAEALQSVIAANNASTQKILDQLCADKLEQKNDVIAQLRSELMYARGQASQDVQTAAIQAGQRALANEVEQYVLPTPRPAYIVQNPNCCASYTGCGM